MNARAQAIAQCRAILAPGFAAYWNSLTRQDRLWFIQCAELPRRKETEWSAFTPDEQNALRSAWATFMQSAAA